MSQYRLTSLMILSIKHKLARDLSYDDIIEKCGKEKFRKSSFEATSNRIRITIN